MLRGVDLKLLQQRITAVHVFPFTVNSRARVNMHLLVALSDTLLHVLPSVTLLFSIIKKPLLLPVNRGF